VIFWTLFAFQNAFFSPRAFGARQTPLFLSFLEVDASRRHLNHSQKFLGGTFGAGFYRTFD